MQHDIKALGALALFLVIGFATVAGLETDAQAQKREVPPSREVTH
jgi:hypothetical protein